MGPKNILIVFFSTVAVSLVILIILFSLFFKNVDLNFNTRLPESAPEIESSFTNTSTMNPDSKAEGVSRSTINVPPDIKEPVADSSKTGTHPTHPNTTSTTNTPAPVSDDVMLDNDANKKNSDIPSRPLDNPQNGTAPLSSPAYGPSPSDNSNSNSSENTGRRRDTETAPSSKPYAPPDNPEPSPPVPANPD